MGQYPYYCCENDSLEETKRKKSEGCTVPSQFVLSAVETNSQGSVVHQIFWDETKLFTRWDRTGPIFGRSDSETLSLITNYTGRTPSSPRLEYLHYPDRNNTCEVAGGDLFYPWGYGATRGQTHERITTAAGDVFDVWASPANGGRWVTKPSKEGEASCEPVSWQVGDRTVQVTKFEAKAPPVGSFVLDKSCHKPHAFKGCRAKATQETFSLMQHS
jgi:hypothetical protein